MPMRRLAVAVALALLLVAVPVDADRGATDFPDSWEDALDVPPGTYDGTVGENDTADWFRVTHPEGKAIRATLRTQDAGVWPRLLDDQGHQVQVGRVHPPGEHEFTRVMWANAPEGVRVGLAWHYGPGSYVLTLEVVDLPDPAVTGVRIRPYEVSTPAGPAEHPMWRFVDVDVANLGSVGTEVALTLYADGAGVSSTHTLDQVGLHLVADQRTTVTFLWKPVGAGDVLLHTLVHIPTARGNTRDVPELSHENNRFVLQEHLLVGGTGVGVVAPGGSRVPA